MLRHGFLFLLLATLVSCVTEVVPRKTNTDPFLRIMPLGDSLTEGINNNGGYRPALYALLKKDALDFQFVGTQQAGPDSLPDKRYEGQGNARIDQIELGLRIKLEKEQPNLILLAAGANDITQRYQVAQAPQRLLELARQIAADLPTAIVVIQSQTLRTDALNRDVIAFNQQIKGITMREHATQPRILFQDNYNLLTEADISPDHVHPNAQGNKKLAMGLRSAVHRALGY